MRKLMHRIQTEAIVLWLGIGMVMWTQVMNCSAQAAPPDTMDHFAQSLERARQAFDQDGITSVQLMLLAEPGDILTTYRGQLMVAEAYLYQADMLRNERKIKDLEGKVKGDYRQRQRSLGERGVSFAESALGLATTDEEKAQAERVIGELYAHQITGPITGIKFGSTSLEHIEQAVHLAPEDIECQRARALMFLYNPSFQGGDVDEAIRVYSDCAERAPENDRVLVLLAQAYRKNDQPEKALETAQEALRANPSNANARAMIDLLQESAK